MHTADPAALVKGDTLWLFTGHDLNGNQNGYVMKDWQLFSTTDMKHWTQHPSPLKIDEFKWAESKQHTPGTQLNATANTIGMSAPTGAVSAWPYPTKSPAYKDALASRCSPTKTVSIPATVGLVSTCRIHRR